VTKISTGCAEKTSSDTPVDEEEKMHVWLVINWFMESFYAFVLGLSEIIILEKITLED